MAVRLYAYEIKDGIKGEEVGRDQYRNDLVPRIEDRRYERRQDAATAVSDA